MTCALALVPLQNSNTRTAYCAVSSTPHTSELKPMKRPSPREKKNLHFDFLLSHCNVSHHMMHVSLLAIIFDSELSPMLLLTLTCCMSRGAGAHSTPVAKQRTVIPFAAAQFGPINRESNTSGNFAL
jgi:hypothetical protein